MPCLHAQLPPQCCYCDSYHGAWSPGPTTTSSSTTNRRPASLASRSRSSSSSSSSQHLVTHSGLVVRSVRGVKIAERTSRFWVKNPVFSLHFPCNTPCPTQPQLISFSLTPLTLFRWPHSPPPTHTHRTHITLQTTPQLLYEPHPRIAESPHLDHIIHNPSSSCWLCLIAAATSFVRINHIHLRV